MESFRTDFELRQFLKHDYPDKEFGEFVDNNVEEIIKIVEIFESFNMISADQDGFPDEDSIRESVEEELKDDTWFRDEVGEEYFREALPDIISGMTGEVEDLETDDEDIIGQVVSVIESYKNY